jgi:26S proteasome regulatory subunit N8
LLRDINDPSTSHLALQIKQKVNGLKGLLSRLNEMKAYLDKVVAGKLPVNNQIIYNIQNILNLLPNLNLEELVNALLVKTNDMHLVVYISSLVRSILALHDLLNNKLKYKDLDAILDRDTTLDNSKDSKSSGKKEESSNVGTPSEENKSKNDSA